MHFSNILCSFQRVLPCSYKFPQKSSLHWHIFEYARNQIGKLYDSMNLSVSVKGRSIKSIY
jgi:hypothetical protein